MSLFFRNFPWLHYRTFLQKCIIDDWLNGWFNHWHSSEMNESSGRMKMNWSPRNLNDMIQQQRMRDRTQKARQEQQERERKKRNQKILETVNQHFPDIEIVSRVERHHEAIEHLAKPRSYSATRKWSFHWMTKFCFVMMKISRVISKDKGEW